MKRKTEAELRQMAGDIVPAIRHLTKMLPDEIHRNNAMPLALACLRVAVEATEFVFAYDQSMEEK